MIPNRITVLILVLVGGVAFAQDLIDVVTTKDGDIFKGVIVENVINEFIRIELEGGSTFRLAYDDIEKIERERIEAESSSPRTPVTFHQPNLFRAYYLVDGTEYTLYLDILDAMQKNQPLPPALNDLIDTHRVGRTEAVRRGKISFGLYLGAVGSGLIASSVTGEWDWTYVGIGLGLLPSIPVWVMNRNLKHELNQIITIYNAEL